MLTCYLNTIGDQGGWSRVSLYLRAPLSDFIQQNTSSGECGGIRQTHQNLYRTYHLQQNINVFWTQLLLLTSAKSSIGSGQPMKPTNGLFNPGTGSGLSMLRFYQEGFRWGFVFQYVVTKCGFGCLGYERILVKLWFAGSARSLKPLHLWTPLAGSAGSPKHLHLQTHLAQFRS